ncbi:hypothetical protein [Pseudothauera nasutitermitis]|nr:hypothetical protein [Pseudothauera nasutitermitis]
MNHAHHDHSHAPRRRRDPAGLLSAGLGTRLGMALGALAVLWLAVLWALG